MDVNKYNNKSLRRLIAQLEGYPETKTKHKYKTSCQVQIRIARLPVVAIIMSVREDLIINALAHKKGQEQFVSFTRATNHQCQDLHLDRRVRALADWSDFASPLLMACGPS